MCWVDVRTELRLVGQYKVYFINSRSKDYLQDKLSSLGFDVCTIDGKLIDSENHFFEQTATVLGFPDYCGNNWDAFYDCLGDLSGDDVAAIALVWDNAPSSIAMSLYTFTRCLSELIALPELYRRDPDSEGIKQFELFFIGEGEEFITLPTLSNDPY